MKKCPLCGASCFEDMDTCYCCMHSFSLEKQGQCEATVEAVTPLIEEEPSAVVLAASGEEVVPDAALAPQAELLFGRDECIRIEIPLRLLTRARLDRSA